jgi:hypothetical protein
MKAQTFCQEIIQKTKHCSGDMATAGWMQGSLNGLSGWTDKEID